MKLLTYILGGLLATNISYAESYFCEPLKKDSSIKSVEIIDGTGIGQMKLTMKNGKAKTASAEYFDDVADEGYHSEKLRAQIFWSWVDMNDSGRAQGELWLFDSNGSVIETIPIVSISTQKSTNDPMEYALKYAREYSIGDSGVPTNPTCEFDDSGSDGGGYGAINVILCSGYRQILVHGGEMVTRPFNCRLTMEPLASSGAFYLVTSEQCN